MYSQTEIQTKISLLGVLAIISLLAITSFAGIVGAAPSTAAHSETVPTDSTANQIDEVQDDTQEWCVSFMNTNRDTSVLGGISCSQVSDISPHQQIQLDYSARNQGPTEYISITMNSQASLPASANISISKDGEEIATYEDADESLAFVEERHYNYLTEDYSYVQDSDYEEISSDIPQTDFREMDSSYTEEEIETLLETEISEDELRDLRLYQMTLEAGQINSITVNEDYTESDFSGSSEEFDYEISLDINSRGSFVGGTDFTVTRTVSRDVLSGEAPSNPILDNQGSSSTSTTADSQVREIVQSGFEVVLNDTIRTDISRYTDGSQQISALQDPSIPPNSNGENDAVGVAENVSNLRENSTRYPAVIYGSGTQNELQFGTAYYGVPEANYHYLVLTYAFQGETDSSQAEVDIINRQGETISSESPRYLPETVDSSIDLNEREQFRQAVEQDTLNTRTVTIALSEQEVRYINNNYESYVTYSTDGGSDTLLLYESSIISTDTPQDGTELPEEEEPESEDYEEDPATFDIEYRMQYERNAEFDQIDVIPGETFSIPVTITNDGDSRVERTIGLYDEYDENHMDYGEIVSERTVMVEPQSERTVILETTWQGYQHGNHSLTIYDTTNEREEWEELSSLEGQTTYSAYVLQPPTLEIIGISTPDSWVQHDHLQSLVAVKNVGDLDTSFYSISNKPFIQGKFGPWQGSRTKYVGGGEVRSGTPGGTVNIYFNRNTNYTADYPNPNQYYEEELWRNNAPYHTLTSDMTNDETGEEYGDFNLTFEAVHPWAVIDGENSVSNTPHTDFVTYDQLEYPQIEPASDGGSGDSTETTETTEDGSSIQDGSITNSITGNIVYESFSPGPDNAFTNYYGDATIGQDNQSIYQNELRNCHLDGEHDTYTRDVSADINEEELVDACGGVWQKGVEIYQLKISNIYLRNTTNEMTDRTTSLLNPQTGYFTLGSEPYYLSAWPYTENDTSYVSSEDNGQGGQNSIDTTEFADSNNHYPGVSSWEPTTFGTNTTMSIEEINSLLAQYENGEITRDNLQQQLLSEQAYQNGEKAFTDRGLDRATSCDGSTTSQLDTPGSPPDCAGFGIDTDTMPTTLIENIQSPVEKANNHYAYVDVHVVNDGESSSAKARIKVITDIDGAGIGGTDVVGYATSHVNSQRDKIVRVPIVVPNEEVADGKHNLQVRVRTEPDYIRYTDDPSVGGSEYISSGENRFGVDFYGETWEDFVFQNVSSPVYNQSYDISQLCSGIGVGQCDTTNKQTTHFSTWNYTNEGGERGALEIESSYGFYETPTGAGSDWPTSHHRDATEHQDVVTDDVDNWLYAIPDDENWASSDEDIQKPRLESFDPDVTETWVMQHQVQEPGIYRVYVTQERVNNEQEAGTLTEYYNTTHSMWGTTAGGADSSVQTYQNQSHYLTYQVYDIKSPVSRFHYEAEDGPRTHSSTEFDDTTEGDVDVWEGGTLHFDGRERLYWSLEQYNNGVADTYNVSSDNVGVELYDWTFSSGDSRIYQQAHDNRGGSAEEGKVSRRFNTSGTHTVELYVEDYPSYTQGAANSNTSRQRVTVTEDNQPPSIDINYESKYQNWNVDNPDVVWSGTPADRSDEFTTVDFSVDVDDNAIGLECGGTLDNGETMDHCGWTKDDGTWNSVDHGDVVEQATWLSTIHYLTRQNSDECIQFYGQDFSANENQDEYCLDVKYDTQDPTAEYTDNRTWIWADHQHADNNYVVEYDASASTDNGDPQIGLHDDAFRHTYDSDGWQVSATEEATYNHDSNDDTRTETETIEVRDWYGNEDDTTESVTVYSDNDRPEKDRCSSGSAGSGDDCYDSEDNTDGEPGGGAEGNYGDDFSNSASAEACIVIEETGVNGGIGIHSVSADGDGEITSESESSTTVCVDADASPSASASASASASTPSACGETNTATDYDQDYDYDDERSSSTVTVEDKHGNTDTWTIEAYAEADEFDTDKDTDSASSGACPTESKDDSSSSK